MLEQFGGQCIVFTLLRSDIPYFPAHEMHRDFFLSNFRKK